MTRTLWGIEREPYDYLPVVEAVIMEEIQAELDVMEVQEYILARIPG